MTGTSLYAGVWAGMMALVLFQARRRWMNFSCVGAYVTSFFVMNYIGLVLAALGYQYVTRDLPIVAEESLFRAITIANVGFVGVLLGIWIVDMMFGKPRVYSNLCILPVTANSRLGMRQSRVAWLLVLYLVLFAVLCREAIPQIVRLVLSGDVVALYKYRLDTNHGNIAATVWVTYNFLPYVAFCGILIYIKRRSARTLFFVVAFAAACCGKLILVHKEPLMVLIVQCCVAWMILRAARDESELNETRPLPLGRIAMGVVIAFSILTLMMWFTHPWSRIYDSLADGWRYSAMMAFERIFGRVSNGYLYIADMIPMYYPHYGFNNSPLWARFMGGDFFAVNKTIFLVTHPGFTTGSIASDSLVNFYGGYGYVGLVILSLGQGMLLAGIDRWTCDRPATLGWLVFLLFMMLFSFYLSETTLFGAMLGFGGLSFAVHALIVNDWHADEPEECEDSPC